MTFLYLSVRYIGIGYAVYVWKFKPLMLRSLPISYNQDLRAGYVSSHTLCFFLVTGGIQSVFQQFR
ncbi:hypothetical protein DFJ58DRAFT_764440 [Suillus subalutaceus]|uniref:uncharacterized protein n=1 Tax=Suillus subalutaceus TaxID=48586 RepID=UPI001B88368E|nr:uncharacterized protein DFJ58DRAFT_764440 [Suillus subalutaceus]KAG1870752.1 hypothetical protein DFJ58DRAFT_764440 [Suillus subalutaceus]